MSLRNVNMFGRIQHGNVDFICLLDQYRSFMKVESLFYESGLLSVQTIGFPWKQFICGSLCMG